MWLIHHEGKQIQIVLQFISVKTGMGVKKLLEQVTVVVDPVQGIVHITQSLEIGGFVWFTFKSESFDQDAMGSFIIVDNE